MTDLPELEPWIQRIGNVYYLDLVNKIYSEADRKKQIASRLEKPEEWNPLLILEASIYSFENTSPQEKRTDTPNKIGMDSQKPIEEKAPESPESLKFDKNTGEEGSADTRKNDEAPDAGSSKGVFGKKAAETKNNGYEESKQHVKTVFYGNEPPNPEGGIGAMLRHSEPIKLIDDASKSDKLKINFLFLDGIQNDCEINHSLNETGPLKLVGVNVFILNIQHLQHRVIDQETHINAVLLRLKLLGTIYAIKREISELLAQPCTTYQSDNKGNVSNEGYRSLFKRARTRADGHDRVHKNVIQGNTATRQRSWLNGYIVPGWNVIEHKINRRLLKFKNIAPYVIFTLITLLMFSSISWFFPGGAQFKWWLPFDPASWTAFSVGALLIGFFLVGMNFKIIDDCEQSDHHEKLNKRLRDSLTRLAQINLSVQVGNVIEDGRKDPAIPKQYTPPAESYIRHVDDVMKTREAVHSLESTIKARLNLVDGNINRLHEEQQKSRRMVMAAGGAIFTGFFVHEVGMSVLEYVHLSHEKDPKNFFLWLSDKNSNTGKLKTAQKVKSNTAEDPVSNFKDEYWQHEVEGTGLVLFIALLFTLMAALLAIRKSPEESGHSGHGGHH